MSLPPPKIVRGEYYFHVGDVILQGADEYGCDFVNDCRARFQPLTANTVVKAIRKKGPGHGQTYERLKSSVGWNYSIRPMYEYGAVIRRMTPAELAKFLAPKNPAAQDAVEPEPVKQETVIKEESEDDMSKEKKPYKGVSVYIHKLRDGGTKKSEALELVRKKFTCNEGALDYFWKTATRGAAKKSGPPAKKGNSAPAKKAPPAKKSTAKAKTPPAPPAKKLPAPPAPVAAPAPAAEPAPEEAPVEAATE